MMAEYWQQKFYILSQQPMILQYLLHCITCKEPMHLEVSDDVLTFCTVVHYSDHPD